VRVAVEHVCDGVHPARLGALGAMGHGHGAVLGRTYPHTDLDGRWSGVALARAGALCGYGAWDREAVERQTLHLSARERPARWGQYHPLAGDNTKLHRTSKKIWGTCTFHEASARRLADFPAEIAQYKPRGFELLAAERIREAFDTVEALPPDLQVVLEPFVTAHCLHSTVNATANATCDVIRALRRGRESVVGAQVRLAGEYLDLHTSIGVPVLVNAAAWSQVVCPPLADDEAHQLRAAAATITANLAQWQR
jgi:hypothetical protein